MSFTPRVGALPLAVALVFAITACSQTEPLAIPKSAPTVTPVFASNADALAAAEKAYTGHLHATDVAAQSGGLNVAGLRAWDSEAEYSHDRKALASLGNKGYHTMGWSTFSDAVLQSARTTDAGEAVVVVYLCLDISGTELLDKEDDNVGQGRPLIAPLQVTFESGAVAPATLVVGGSVEWQGKNFCS